MASFGRLHLAWPLGSFVATAGTAGPENGFVWQPRPHCRTRNGFVLHDFPAGPGSKMGSFGTPVGFIWRARRYRQTENGFVWNRSPIVFTRAARRPVRTRGRSSLTTLGSFGKGCGGRSTTAAAAYAARRAFDKPAGRFARSAAASC